MENNTIEKTIAGIEQIKSLNKQEAFDEFSTWYMNNGKRDGIPCISDVFDWLYNDSTHTDLMRNTECRNADWVNHDNRVEAWYKFKEWGIKRYGSSMTDAHNAFDWLIEPENFILFENIPNNKESECQAEAIPFAEANRLAIIEIISPALTYETFVNNADLYKFAHRIAALATTYWLDDSGKSMLEAINRESNLWKEQKGFYEIAKRLIEFTDKELSLVDKLETTPKSKHYADCMIEVCNDFISKKGKNESLEKFSAILKLMISNYGSKFSDKELMVDVIKFAYKTINTEKDMDTILAATEVRKIAINCLAELEEEEHQNTPEKEKEKDEDYDETEDATENLGHPIKPIEFDEPQKEFTPFSLMDGIIDECGLWCCTSNQFHNNPSVFDMCKGVMEIVTCRENSDILHTFSSVLKFINAVIELEHLDDDSEQKDVANKIRAMAMEGHRLTIEESNKTHQTMNPYISEIVERCQEKMTRVNLRCNERLYHWAHHIIGTAINGCNLECTFRYIRDEADGLLSEIGLEQQNFELSIFARSIRMVAEDGYYFATHPLPNSSGEKERNEKIANLISDMKSPFYGIFSEAEVNAIIKKYANDLRSIVGEDTEYREIISKLRVPIDKNMCPCTGQQLSDYFKILAATIENVRKVKKPTAIEGTTCQTQK